ncbi:hypothetical protein [Lentzea sp. NPDC055074]
MTQYLAVLAIFVLRCPRHGQAQRERQLLLRDLQRLLVPFLAHQVVAQRGQHDPQLLRIAELPAELQHLVVRPQGEVVPSGFLEVLRQLHQLVRQRAGRGPLLTGRGPQFLDARPHVPQHLQRIRVAAPGGPVPRLAAGYWLDHA